MNQIARNATLALIATTFALLLLAAPSRAGTLTYDSCQDPDGQFNGAVSGWTAAQSGGGHVTELTCDAKGPGFRFGLFPGVHGEGDLGGFEFAAPPDLRIVGVTLNRRTVGLSRCTHTGSCNDQHTLLHYDLTPGNGVHVDTCSPFAPGQTPGQGQCDNGLDGIFIHDGLDVSSLELSVSCGYATSGSCDTESEGAAVAVAPWVRVRMADDFDPVIGSVTGSLASDNVLSGVSTLHVSATDRGSGLSRWTVVVDGKTATTGTIDSDDVDGVARCVDTDPTNTDPYEWRWPVPCKLSAGTEVSLDTKTLSDGVHSLGVTVEDATGNTARAVATHTVTVTNQGSVANTIAMPGVTDGGGVKHSATLRPGVQNGENASAHAHLTAYFDRTHTHSLTSAYGTRVVVRGKLQTAAGTGIRNARVELRATPSVPGARAIDKGGVRTRRNGTWTLILPANASSRSLSFRYRTHLGDAKPVANVGLRLRVRAGVALRVSPQRAHNGSLLEFNGRLLGGPMPHRGKVVELQARGKGGGKWLTFLTPRTAATGRFRARYRLRNTVGPVSYVFRALVRAETGYPYLTGASRLRGVVVR